MKWRQQVEDLVHLEKKNQVVWGGFDSINKRKKCVCVVF